VTLTNRSATPLVVSGVSIVGPDAGNFRASFDGCRHRALAPQHSCIVQVEFTPSAAGLRSAKLTFRGDHERASRAITLTGIGSGAARLAVALSAIHHAVTSGTALAYTVSVTDRGPGVARDVVVTDPIPVGARFTNISENGWSCTTPAPGDRGIVICKLSALAIGHSRSFSLTVTRRQGWRSDVTDSARVGSQTAVSATAAN
jgi:uncharacterized repeat protein (TIGR01451 family)